MTLMRAWRLLSQRLQACSIPEAIPWRLATNSAFRELPEWEPRFAAVGSGEPLVGTARSQQPSQRTGRTLVQSPDCTLVEFLNEGFPDQGVS